MHTALEWAIADKVILGKEISKSVKCFQKTQKSEQVGDGLQLTGDDDDDFLKFLVPVGKRGCQTNVQ